MFTRLVPTIDVWNSTLKPEVQENSVDQDINSSIRSTCLSFRYVLAGVQTCEPRDKRRPWIGRLDVEVFRD
jgi:hypothetical protein